MVLTFGEIMLRLSTPGHQRFSQCLPGTLGATFGGGEANVAVSLAHLGDCASFMTVVPDNTVSACLLAELRRYGVDTTRVRLSKEGRFGIYFVEAGSNQRSGVVVYDRAGSSIALAEPAEYDFKAALDGVDWLHTTGITPALSRAACDAAISLCREAATRKIPVSVDLNFRKKLWRWDPSREPKTLARECMTEMLQHVSLVIANEEDAADVLGIHAAGTRVESGAIAAEGYIDVAREIAQRFPSVQQVAITLRESCSADYNNWGAMLYDCEAKKAYFAPLDGSGQYHPYEIKNIIDRFGGGDSFCAGLIYALHHDDFKAPQTALSFAVAASCLKHSIPGDYNYSSLGEVVALMGGNASGRVMR